MPYKVISFDLQGTISDSAFSDAFWLELLPKLYAEKYHLTDDEAKKQLKEIFKSVGRYDRRYYAFEDWLKTLEVTIPWSELVKLVHHEPKLNSEMENLVLRLSETYPLLLFSATTRQFIDWELGKLAHAFTWIISAIDDLNCAGKPDEAYHRIAKRIGVQPHEIIHIGDDILMDVQHAKSAGWQALSYRI